MVAVSLKTLERLEFWDCEPLSPKLCELFRHNESLKHFVCKNTFIAYGRDPLSVICNLLLVILANENSALESLVWCPLEIRLTPEFVDALSAIKSKLEYIKIEEIGCSK